MTGAPRDELRRYVTEIEHDRQFTSRVRQAYRRYTAYLPTPRDFMVEPTDGGTMFFHLVSLYALVRAIRPEMIVETGGTPGKSSAFILRALQRNGKGILYTIDLPPERVRDTVIESNRSHSALPQGAQPNWCVPSELRERHRLLLGPAQEHLPVLLRHLGHIDLFIHDSDHSFAHMMWEFRTAFPFLHLGGYLWSDDILGNTAWRDFCAEMHLDCYVFLSQGVTRKPWAGR